MLNQHSYLLFVMAARKTGAGALDMGGDDPTKQLIESLSDEQLRWLIDVCQLEQEAQRASESGDLKKALLLYEEVLTRAPWNSIAQMSIGVIAAVRGDGQKAIDLLEKAVRLDPSNKQIRGNFEAIQRDFQAFEEKGAVAIQNVILELSYDNVEEKAKEAGAIWDRIPEKQKALVLRSAEAHMEDLGNLGTTGSDTCGLMSLFFLYMQLAVRQDDGRLAAMQEAYEAVAENGEL